MPTQQKAPIPNPKWKGQLPPMRGKGQPQTPRRKGQQSHQEKGTANPDHKRGKGQPRLQEREGPTPNPERMGQPNTPAKGKPRPQEGRANSDQKGQPPPRRAHFNPEKEGPTPTQEKDQHLPKRGMGQPQTRKVRVNPHPRVRRALKGVCPPMAGSSVLPLISKTFLRLAQIPQQPVRTRLSEYLASRCGRLLTSTNASLKLLIRTAPSTTDLLASRTGPS